MRRIVLLLLGVPGWFVAQVAQTNVDLNAFVGLLPDLALTGVVLWLWVTGRLIARPEVDRLETAHRETIARIVAGYEDRISDHERTVERALAEVDRAEQRERDAHALVLRTVGVAEAAVTDAR